jgi:hypothetical protein
MVDEIKKCKLINSYYRVCQQNHPVQVMHLHEECEVEMLQSEKYPPAVPKEL